MRPTDEPAAQPRSPSRRARRALLELALAAVLLAGAWVVLGAVATWQHPDRTDEPEWVAISILHTDQLVHATAPAGAELDPPEWREGNAWRRGVQRTMFGYPNPCLPKLVWGGLLHAAGFDQASPLVFDVFERADPAAGARAQRALDPALPLARRVVLALACLSAVLVFFAARAALPGGWGWLCAALAYGLWFASPLVRTTATYVRTDFFMLPFVLGALLLALGGGRSLAGERGAGRQALLGLLLGLLCGLAVASKLNGALVCVCVAAWIPLAWWRARGLPGRASWRGPVLALGLAGATSFAVFYALNPRLWGDPLGGVQDILARWERMLGFFQETWSQRTGVAIAQTLPERAALFVDRTLTRDDPWRALTGLPGGGALMLGGLALLAWRALRPGSTYELGASGRSAQTLLGFALVFALGTALWLPIDWARFWLPVAPVVVVLEALCLAWLTRQAWERLLHRRAGA
jgi:hypothetical protein